MKYLLLLVLFSSCALVHKTLDRQVTQREVTHSLHLDSLDHKGIDTSRLVGSSEHHSANLVITLQVPDSGGKAPASPSVYWVKVDRQSGTITATQPIRAVSLNVDSMSRHLNFQGGVDTSLFQQKKTDSGHEKTTQTSVHKLTDRLGVPWWAWLIFLLLLTLVIYWQRRKIVAVLFHTATGL